MIDRFNSWYDSLKEPKRFGFFMLLMCLSVFPLNMGVSAYGTPYAAIATPLMLFGLTTTLLVCYVAAIRAAGHGGKHKYAAYGLMGVMTFVALAVCLLVFF